VRGPHARADRPLTYSQAQVALIRASYRANYGGRITATTVSAFRPKRRLHHRSTPAFGRGRHALTGATPPETICDRFRRNRCPAGEAARVSPSNACLHHWTDRGGPFPPCARRRQSPKPLTPRRDVARRAGAARRRRAEHLATEQDRGRSSCALADAFMSLGSVPTVAFALAAKATGGRRGLA
jgi:hypothetical protein